MVDDLEALISRHLADDLEHADAARLHARLRDDATARRLLRDAAVQANALPRLALGDGLGRPAASSFKAPGWSDAGGGARRWRWQAAGAALLLIALLIARVPSTPPHGVLVVGQADAQPLQAGARITAENGPLQLAWNGEATALTLDQGAHLVVEQALGAKRLRLEQGALQAEVAPQPSDGGLTIVTPFASIAVVGTRFRVQVESTRSLVSVSHGAVRVHGSAGDTVTVAAGFSLACGVGPLGQPAPVAHVPPPPGPLASTPGTVRIDATTARPGQAWEGAIDANGVHGVQIERNVTRVIAPLARPGGYQRFADDFTCTVRVAVAQATTVSVLLVCDLPQGDSAWVGNIQGQRAVLAGEQTVTFTAADFARTTAGTMPPADSRVVAVAVMCWGPATDLTLHWIDLTR